MILFWKDCGVDICSAEVHFSTTVFDNPFGVKQINQVISGRLSGVLE